jgi:uncharacterized protein (DUF1501 family)
MKRRDFLRHAMAAPAAAATLMTGSNLLFGLKPAHAAVGKSLIVIFQRGGCDGLNTVVPYGDPNYYNLRPTIGIPSPNSGAARTALDLNGFFGLHPSLEPLMDIYQNGNMAIMPATHYPGASRSHFDGQKLIESGSSNQFLDGWLNRHLVSLDQAGVIRAVGFGNAIPHSLIGGADASTFNDLSDFGLGDRDGQADELRARLRAVFSQDVPGGEINRQLIHDQGNLLLDNLNVISQIDVDNYQPANGAVYPGSSYGRQLRQAAQLVKEGVGLEVATVSIGGWDTHSNQGGADENGTQARRFADFSAGIRAFHDDMGSRMDDVIVLTMTEFGRTAEENGSRGTDHGNAASWFAVGNNINGGIYGQWPGLSTEQLYRERYLAQATDYRDIFGDILTRHMGNNNLSTVLPGHTYTPTGIL